MSIPVSTHEIASDRGLDGSGRDPASEDAAGKARGEAATPQARADRESVETEVAPVQIQPDGR